MLISRLQPLSEKFLRNEYSERCTYRATNNTDNLCANCECIEFGVITRPVVRWARLTGSLKTADNVAVRIRTQTGGTFVAPSPFWRRASRKSAEGAKTDLAAGFLFLSNGGITETSCVGTLKYNAIVIGWYFDHFLDFNPPASTDLIVSSGDILNSVFGPRGSPRMGVSSRGRLCQLTIANSPSGFSALRQPAQIERGQERHEMHLP